MAQERVRLLGIVVIFLCVCFLIHILILQEHDSTVEITLVLSNSLSPSNHSWRSSLPLSLLPANDSSQLINITDFKFLINPECSESMFFVCVHSAPGNYVKRQLVRSTWGAHVPLFFFIGETSLENQIELDAESSEFHDLVQGTFVDSYRNLTYKHTMVFKWIVYHCPHVKYVFKSDDDMFLNIPRLEEFLTTSLSPHGTQNLLMCPHVYYHDAALRGYRSKWRVSYKEYRPHYYPPYCRGPVLLYSPDMMFKLYQRIQTDQKYFWVDDVFITGIVFAKLNQTHANFDWWLGEGKSLLIINQLSDVQKFDPHENLFAFFTNNNMPEKFKSLNNVTFLQTNVTSVDNESLLYY